MQMNRRKTKHKVRFPFKGREIDFPPSTDLEDLREEAGADFLLVEVVSRIQRGHGRLQCATRRSRNRAIGSDFSRLRLLLRSR